LLRDVFIWAYERSVQQYIEVQRTMAQPDPLRLTYRQELCEILGAIVRGVQVTHIREALDVFASEKVLEKDRESFVAMAIDDIKRLHMGVIARYRIRPSEFEAWKAKRKLSK